MWERSGPDEPVLLQSAWGQCTVSLHTSLASFLRSLYFRVWLCGKHRPSLVGVHRYHTERCSTSRVKDRETGSRSAQCMYQWWSLPLPRCQRNQIKDSEKQHIYRKLTQKVHHMMDEYIMTQQTCMLFVMCALILSDSLLLKHAISHNISLFSKICNFSVNTHRHTLT